MSMNIPETLEDIVKKKINYLKNSKRGRYL